MFNKNKVANFLKLNLVFTLLALIATTFNSTTALSARAQSNDIELEISPPITHLIVQPDKQATQNISVKNTGNFALGITPRLLDFTSDNKTGNPIILDQFSFPYVKLNHAKIQLDQSFNLPANSEQTLQFDFNIPDSAELEEYHFILLLEAKPEFTFTADTATTPITSQIGSNFIVTITDQENDQGEIVIDVFNAPLLVDSFSAISPQIFVKNTGKNMTVTVGELEVYDFFGRQLMKQSILPQNILPNASRQLWAADFIHQQTEIPVAIPFSYNPPILIGPYTLKLTYQAPNQPSQTYEYKVYAVPFSMLFFFSLGVIFIFLTKNTGLLKLDKEYKKRESKL